MRIALHSAVGRNSRLAIGVERVVRRELPRHVVMVVLRVRLEPCGQRVEAWGLRSELTRIGIGAAHDDRECTQRRIVELVLLEEGVERALLTMMAELD